MVLGTGESLQQPPVVAASRNPSNVAVSGPQTIFLVKGVLKMLCLWFVWRRACEDSIQNNVI